MKRVVLKLSFLLLCITLQSIPSLAQYGSYWKKIGQLPKINGQTIHATCGFFVNNQFGIVGASRTQGGITYPANDPEPYKPRIYYTVNGGVTWTESTVPNPPIPFGCELTSIRMIDRNEGYACMIPGYRSGSGYTGSAIWKTTNGGQDWLEVDNPGAWDIFVNIIGDLLIAARSVSGSTFAHLDSSVVITNPGANAKASLSTDGGISWTQGSSIYDSIVTPSVSYETYGCYGSRKWKVFIASESGESTYDRRPIISYDSGKTWNFTIGSITPLTVTWNCTGDVEGGTDAIYVQSSFSSPTEIPIGYRGLLKTIDSGKTWKYINGPFNHYLTRFCTFGCRGANVVAFDTIGGIWLTENGGDGTMHEDTARLWFAANKLSITSSLCDTVTNGIRLWNEHCNIVRLDSMWFDSRDSFLFTSGALQVDTLPFQGRILGVDATDSIGFTWRPRIITDRDTTYKVPLHIRYWTETTNEIKDTVLLIELNSARGNTSHTLSSYSIDFTTVSMCSSRDTVITITNNGCDTLRITDVQLQGDFDYLLTQNPNGVRLAPGASATVSVRYSPSSSGTVLASLFITLWEQGKLTTREVPLRGTGIEDGGVFAYEPKSFDFNTLSICSRDSGSGYITNTGCDTLSLTDAKLFADADYTISSLPPISLIPFDTIRYQVYLNPQLKGVRRGYVIFTTTTRSGLRRDSIPLTVNVTDGTRILSSSRNTLDFGTTTLCEERDSLVTLRNTGCDTLKVSGYRLQGVGFSSNVTTPIIIPPGGSVEIPINTIVDTSQGNISTGTITFTSDADNQMSPITLSRGYIYPKSYSFHIAMLDATATPDEIVRLAIVGEQGLGSVGSGVNRLDFDLSLNEDLLEYIRPEGSNTVNKNGSRITISNLNELTSIDDTLAVLVYHVFLTKDSATDITVSNVSINNGDTSSCAPKIAAITQTGFTYRYECGDKQIQSFLRTGQASLEIRSLVPNPTASDITISIESSAEQTATLEIYDMLGKEYYEKAVLLSKESTDLTIVTSLLPEGQYIVRIGTPTGSSSRIFTKR